MRVRRFFLSEVAIGLIIFLHDHKIILLNIASAPIDTDIVSYRAVNDDQSIKYEQFHHCMQIVVLPCL